MAKRFGRIRRDRNKIARAASGGYGSPRKGPTVTSMIVRSEYIGSTGYEVSACIPGKHGTERKSCAWGTGRTPQSAFAKALKALSNKVAKRGGKRH